MSATLVRFTSPHHPAVQAARRFIEQQIKKVPPAGLFIIAAVVEQLATGKQHAHWSESAVHAMQHPEAFRKKAGKR